MKITLDLEKREILALMNCGVSRLKTRHKMGIIGISSKIYDQILAGNYFTNQEISDFINEWHIFAKETDKECSTPKLRQSKFIKSDKTRVEFY